MIAKQVGAPAGQDARQPLPVVVKGSEWGRAMRLRRRAGHPTTRAGARKGVEAAKNRARALRKDLPALSADREAMLAVVARLIVIYENATLRLFRDGELTEGGDVRVLLSRTVPDLYDRIERGMRYVFGDGKAEGNW